MKQFKETFMNIWIIEEDPNMLYDMEEEENYEEKQGLPHDSIEEREHEEVSHEDEVMIFSPPIDEVIQTSIPPAQEEESVVSHFPFQFFDDAFVL